MGEGAPKDHSDVLGALRDVETDVELSRRALLSVGVYDASGDSYVNPDHDDDHWVNRSVN